MRERDVSKLLGCTWMEPKGCKRKGRYAAYGLRDKRIAVLPRDHFLCKIKYFRYDGSGHTRVHTRIDKEREKETDRKRERGAFLFGQGRILRS